MPDRHRVPTHVDTADGIGVWSVRQWGLIVGSAMFVGPGAAMLMPPAGPTFADLVSLSGALAYAAPVALATAMALPLEPPIEHGLISWAKYRASSRLLGPREIDELLGYPEVGRNIAHAHGKSIAIWEMPSVSMRMASDTARNVERARWAAFLDGLPCPIQTTVRAVPIDLEATFKTMANHSSRGAAIANYLRASTAAGGEVERRRLLSITADDDDQLQRYAEDIDGALARATLAGKRLEDDDLADTIHTGWTSRPRKGKRIGPNTIRVEADGLNIDGEWVSTLAHQRWPSTVAVDFMAPLYDGSQAIDCVQIIKPLDQLKVRRQLETRLTQLNSTSATRQRAVAIEQLDGTLNALERNEERVFEVDQYCLIRAVSRDLMTTKRRRVEQIVGEYGGVAASLRWEHPEGVLACSATMDSRLLKRTHRVDTSSLSRAYPWSASELGLKGAVPWGRTLYGNRRVGWTPFRRPQLSNPNTAVYATSGGGKGFGVKVWTSRALFAGTIEECFVVDQAEESRDGEYGRWCRYVQGEVRKLSRGTWEADLKNALADIPNGTLPPAIVVNIADLPKIARCHAMSAFKRAVIDRAAEHEAQRSFVLDEMWSFQDDTEASDEAEDLVRRGRHFRLGTFFMTQRPMDALDSSLGKTVQSQCASQWFGMQNPSEISDVSSRLRWTPEQIGVIERFGPGDAMLVAGLNRVAFRVDYSPEEWAMAHTDTTKGERDGRPEYPDLALELAAWTVTDGSTGRVAHDPLDGTSTRLLDEYRQALIDDDDDDPDDEDEEEERRRVEEGEDEAA